MQDMTRRTPSPNGIKKLNARQIAQIRALIPIGRVVRRLSGFAVGDWEVRRVRDEDGVETHVECPIEMNANQVRAAVALLNKMLPDLQSMQLEVTDDSSEVTLEQLRAQLRSIVMSSEAIDVEVREVKNDLLELGDRVSDSDLLSLD